MARLGSAEDFYEVSPWTALHSGKSIISITVVFSVVSWIFADATLAGLGVAAGLIIAPIWSLATWVRIGTNSVEVVDGRVYFRRWGRVVFERVVDDSLHLEILGHDFQPLLEYLSAAYPMYSYVTLPVDSRSEIEVLVRGDRQLRMAQEALTRAVERERR